MNHLSELRGQKIASRLLNAYLHGRIPPLLIFHGMDGTGKWSAAEAFIRQRLCKVGTGCGNCPPCQMLSQNSHPDLIQFPEDRILIGDAKNPEEFSIRWLIRTRICYSPFSGEERFVIFPAADRIQHEAETALLKTLEDAPDHTRFIFITRDLKDLKETIISRGVCVPFNALPLDDLRAFGEVGENEVELLGGSVHLIPFFQSDLFKQLSEKIRDGLTHPLELNRLESWLLTEDRKGFSNFDIAKNYPKEEILDIAAMLFLQMCSDQPRRNDIWREIFNFKSNLHRNMSGLTPYLLSRLFLQLEILLFKKPGG